MFDVLRQFKFCSHIVIVTSNLPRVRRKAYGNCQTCVKVLISVLKVSKVGGQLHAAILLPRKRSPRNPINRILNVAQNLSGRFGEKLNFLPLQEIEPRFLGRPFRAVVTVPTKRFHLLIVTKNLRHGKFSELILTQITQAFCWPQVKDIHTQPLLWHANILKIQHVITVGFVYSPLFESECEL